MSTKQFAELTSSTRSMITGLKSHESQVAKRGADATFTTNLETLLGKTTKAESEEAELKAQLKIKSEEVENLMTVLKKEYGDARKIVKLSIEQAGWKAFGIDDVK